MVISKKLLSLVLCLFLSLSTVFADDAQVMAVTGKAEVQKGSDWVALAVGDKVPKGAVISTGFKSELLLKVNSSNIKMGPLTRLTVEQLVQSSSANKTSLFIDSGKVNVEVNKTGGKREDFKVSSPIATASVRGTAFTLFADGRLATHSGLVSKSASTSKKPRISTAEEDAAFIAEYGEITEDTDSSESSDESAEVAKAETEEESEEAEEESEDEASEEATEENAEESTTDDVSADVDEAVNESKEIAESSEESSSTEENTASEKASEVAVKEKEVKPVQKENKGTKENKVSVFTSSFADGGTPVFAGQSSKTDSFTGQQTSAQTAAAQSASISSSGTTSLASQESVTTAPAVSSSSSSTPVVENNAPVAPKPTLTVIINFPQKK